VLIKCLYEMHGATMKKAYRNFKFWLMLKEIIWKTSLVDFRARRVTAMNLT